MSSLSKADFTRFQHKIFSKPITIVNTALFVLNFLNLPQGDILTRAEKHFKELKDTSLPLPIWYQDGLTKQWKYGKLILQGNGYACISPDGSNKLTWLPLWKIQPKGAPRLQNRDKTTKTPGGRNPNTGHGGPKDHRKRHPRQHQPYDCPTWGHIETLTSQAENLVSQQGMPRSPEYILLAMLSLLARASPIQALTNHTYWAHIPNPSLLHVDRERTNGFN